MKANKKIRAGIVGAGLMGYWHLAAIRRAGGEALAIVDYISEKSLSFAKEHKIPHSFQQIEQLLAQLEIDVLHICSPLNTHYPIAHKALKAGLHLFIEKPLVATAAQTQFLLDLALQNDKLLCPVHQFLFQSGVTKAHKILDQIGEIHHIQSVICSAGGVGKEQRELDAIVAEILPHPLSLMQLFSAQGLPQVWQASYQNGEFRATSKELATTLDIFISMNIRPPICTLRLMGTKGIIDLDLFHGFAFIETGKVSRWRKILRPFVISQKRFSVATGNILRRIALREPAYPGLWQLVRKFYQAVANAGESPISARDTLAVAQIRDLLIEQTELI